MCPLLQRFHQIYCVEFSQNTLLPYHYADGKKATIFDGNVCDADFSVSLCLAYLCL